MKIYKLQRISDGLYSTGGYYPRFTEDGKSWNKIGHMKSHMTMLKRSYEYNFPGQYPYINTKNFQIIEIEVNQTVASVNKIPLA
jgi:hypothetical protein